jgi:hypothetical protein
VSAQYQESPSTAVRQRLLIQSQLECAWFAAAS